MKRPRFHGAVISAEVSHLAQRRVGVCSNDYVVEYFDSEHLPCAEEFAGDADVCFGSRWVARGMIMHEDDAVR